MSELMFSTVFQEITCVVKDQSFFTMYFGRHWGKNLVVLKHNITMMMVFGDNNKWSAPEMIKTVSVRGNGMKGVKIVGSDDVVLLLDESGKLWKLINAYDAHSNENECFHSLNNSCFYEWVQFSSINFDKVLAVCALQRGFAFLGLTSNQERRLVVLHSVDSPVEDYTFEELNTVSSFSFYLVSVKIKIENSVFKNELKGEENLLITDNSAGRTYLCGMTGRNYLINQSSIHLISAFDYPEKCCLLLCYQNGKLVFYFYDKSPSHEVAYLAKEVTFVEKCVCFETCLLWSDGIGLHHSKLSFDPVKVTNLEVKFAVESPLSVLFMYESALVVTVNNIYYFIRAGLSRSCEIQKPAKDVLSEFTKHTNLVAKYEQKIEMLTHYLYCKNIVQNNKVKEKVEMKWEGNRLIIKSFLNARLKDDIWKLRLKTSRAGKELVQSVDFDCDLCEGMMVTVDNPFGFKCNIRVSLVGDFDGEFLFLDLGEVEGFEEDFEKNHLRKQLMKILMKKNPSKGIRLKSIFDARL